MVADNTEFDDPRLKPTLQIKFAHDTRRGWLKKLNVGDEVAIVAIHQTTKIVKIVEIKNTGYIIVHQESKNPKFAKLEFNSAGNQVMNYKSRNKPKLAQITDEILLRLKKNGIINDVYRILDSLDENKIGISTLEVYLQQTQLLGKIAVDTPADK